MTDPMNPPQNNQSGAATSTGLEPNVSALLSYVFGAVSGLIFFLIEKKHREVRFHAAQSVLFGVVAIAVAVGASIISVILPSVLAWIFSAVMFLVWLGMFGVWIFLVVSGYQLKHVKLPVIGDYAEKMAAGQPVQ